MRRRSFVWSGLAAVLWFFGPRKQLAAGMIHMDTTEGELSMNTNESTLPRPMEMNVGAFSVSLAVNDLNKSKEFYEKLGFKSFAGDAKQKWLILKNGDHVIGLFQGMFAKNILTFNPGWDQNAKKLDKFTDVRELQRQLKEQGVKLTTEANEKSTGPASFTLADPDGNQILFDQHV
jgi:predicted lactoylglutathione lyase